MDDLLKMRSITKSFGPVEVLKDVDLTLMRGSVHALLGSNGAGKSTLMKILSGNHMSDSGEVYLKGKKISIVDPKSSKENGISIIHQEFNLIPDLTVYENVFLGKEIRKGFLNFINSKKESLKHTQKLIDKYGLDIDAEKPIRELSVGEQQVVEILKAISEDSSILIMDEPTAALSIKESERLFEVVESIKAQGIGIIYISHRLDEIQRICDYVTVMRDGKNIKEGGISEFSNEKIIEYMVGTKMENMFPEKNNIIGEDLLALNHLSNEFINNINISVKKGEILGLFGLIGSGHTKVLDALFGINKIMEGVILINGKEEKISSPSDAKKLGIAYVTENRKEEGLILDLGVTDNIIIPSMKLYASYGVKNQKKIMNAGKYYKEKLSIKLNHLSDPVVNLSGGNQQKVVLSKWLATQPEVILLSEPTRGIDVGARSEIYRILTNLTTEEEKAVLMASSDSEEVLGLSDRILIFFEGKIVAEIKAEEATPEILMEYASGARNAEGVKIDG
ncbi:sugar ABC transporter ATP-binding protein [Oceanobacillus jeddahense]|uniref:Sugar ABC transporter ATP-binding protein n=1 Tax=Oceanobacillus jeddahense TaxID=1462527 RepID=A0ABY5JVW4_9BACI|nr:sugar ABC transporter ATP-binding protein [Oceanobacillus jeddahense]UUI02992.1 sugar ABC transporter ATP-binding protein [Oceanobacillus jeddahense]